VLAEGRHIFVRRPKPRAAKKPETALEKSLAPRLDAGTFVKEIICRHVNYH